MHLTARLGSALILTVGLPLVASARTLPARSVIQPSRSALAVDHEMRAKRFLEGFGREGASPSELEFEAFLAEEFVSLELGLFDIYLPSPALEEPRSCENFQRTAQALLQAQMRWLEWLELGKEETKAASAEVAALAKWIKSWKPTKWEFDGDAGHGALHLSGADDELRAVSAAFADRMGSGSALGLDRGLDAREALVLIPERARFVECISFAGWIRPDLKSDFWKEDTHTWTNFYLEKVKVLAMEFASPGGSKEDYGASMDMSARTPTGLEQQIVQLSMNSLIDNYFGSKIPPTFAGGLAINLVVDLFEECNTRADGDLSERRTEAIEIFVPGGNPTGGWMAGSSADSRWRESQGADRFVRVLRNAQKDGAGEMKAKGNCNFFEIRDEAGSESKVLSAPFLGAGAAKREPLPASFEGEQIEFLRAYRCAFLYWLQNESMGKAKDSRAAFADFLKRLAKLESAAEIEASFAASFDGISLSSGEPDRKGDLEGRFLYWLSKKKR